MLTRIFANKFDQQSGTNIEMSARDKFMNSTTPSFTQEEEDEIANSSFDSTNTLNFPICDEMQNHYGGEKTQVRDRKMEAGPKNGVKFYQWYLPMYDLTIA